jgi:hypothetical protein
METIKTSKIILIGLLLCNALLLLTLYIQHGAVVFNDSHQYQRLANSIANGEFGSTIEGTYYPEALRLVGYPFFIFVCQSIFGQNVLAVVIPQIILHFVALWLVFSATKNAFGQTTGFIFLALSAAYPVISYSALTMLPETITIFLFALAVFLLSKQDYRRRVLNFVAAGIILGVSFYVRPNLLPIALITGLFVFIGVRRYRRLTVLLITALLITVAPQAIFNYLTFGIISPTTAQAGFEIVLYQGTLESAGKMGTKEGTYEAIDDERIQKQLREIKNTLGLPPHEMIYAVLDKSEPGQILLTKRTLRQASFENISFSPLTYIIWSLKNVPRMWIDFFDLPPDASRIYRYAGLLWGLVVLLFAITGCIIGISSKNEDAHFFGIFAGGTIFAFSFTLCWLHFETRYANTAKFIFLAVAAVAIHHLLSKLSLLKRETIKT